MRRAQESQSVFLARTSGDECVRLLARAEQDRCPKIQPISLIFITMRRITGVEASSSEMERA